MKDKFDELTRDLAQSVTRTLLCLAALAQLTATTRATDFKRGPVINVSDPDVFAGCTVDGRQSDGAEKETWIAANPANLKNIVAIWWGGYAKGIVSAATLDGGRSWQQAIVPGLTLCTGGTYAYALDGKVSFSPNGSLYAISLSAGLVGSAVHVNRSTDGGLHWGSPTVMEAGVDERFGFDQPTVSADPLDSRFVYATWEQVANGNRRFIKFSRSTDGGATWGPARQILDPGNSDQVSTPQIVVLPNGTLVCAYLDLFFSNGNGGGYEKLNGVLSVIRSTDKGLTWTAPIAGPRTSIFQALDPDTGFPVGNQNWYPPVLSAVAVDRSNGTLYAVWEDVDFSSGQTLGIAFSQSTDGGSHWSEPIQVNKTPTDIPIGNQQAFLPTIAVASDGTIGVAYYDFRFNDAQPGLPTDRWFVHCHPSASNPATHSANWGNELRLTDTSFDIEKAPSGFGVYFVGDYEGLTAVGRGFVAAWSQPHDNDMDSVFVRRVEP